MTEHMRKVRRVFIRLILPAGKIFPFSHPASSFKSQLGHNFLSYTFPDASE